MTALATVGALLPLLFGGDGSVLISKALAVTVIGGLTSSTLLTLIVVPVVYEILMNLKQRFTKDEKRLIHLYQRMMRQHVCILKIIDKIF